MPPRCLVVAVVLVFSLSLFFCPELARAQASEAAPAGPGYWQVSDADGLLRAASQMPASGGTIVLRPGYYTIDTTISFAGMHHVNIMGSGWNTVIQRQGAGSALVFTDCSFCTVRNLLMVGDSSASEGSGILFRDSCSSNTVDFCRICSFPESGISFRADPEKVPQSSNTVSNCHFIDNHTDQLDSYYNNDFYIIGNQFGAHARSGDLAPRTGAVLDHSSAGTYSRNYHWGNRVAMRLGPGANFNRIENNRFENSLEHGIVIGDPDGGNGSYLNIILGNTIHTNSMAEFGGYAAVEAYDASSITFCANQVFSWNSASCKHKSSLVLLRGCHNWIVKDNMFHHNTEKALVYSEGNGNIVKDNITD